jgi:cellulose synthase/poly-beta-1,6-N-acetylglucosamine synthase-like glycosyltransferase
MTLSFSIPAHNEEDRIGGCLEAIRREAAVAGVAVEIVVVNNASTDKTAEVAGRIPGVKVVREDRKGLLFARERGAKETTGELIANIDADTKLTPDWIKKVLKAFEDDPDLVGYSGPFIYYDLPWVSRVATRLWYIIGHSFHVIWRIFTGREAMLQGGNFVLRRSALEKIGGFDTTISFYGEDTDIAKRMSKVGKVRFSFNLPILASGRRMAKDGVFITGWRYAINHFWVLAFDQPYTKEYSDVRTGQNNVQK